MALTFSKFILWLKRWPWPATLKMWVVLNPITMSNYSSKPGTLLWTQSLGTITSYYQKPTKASREHELHGHAHKLGVTLLEIPYDDEFRFHIIDEG